MIDEQAFQEIFGVPQEHKPWQEQDDNPEDLECIEAVSEGDQQQG
jgi:hypothetical protein